MRFTLTHYFIILVIVFPTACHPISPTTVPLPNATQSQSMAALPTMTTKIDDSQSLPIMPQENRENVVLTPAQKNRIYFASLAYLASDENQTKIIMQILQNEKNDGDITKMSGALAIAILKDARLISQDTDLHDFWLIDAMSIAQTFKKTFPENIFTKYHFDQLLNEHGLSSFPLLVGDFLGLFNGASYQFLVVTRVDNQGRAYSVTNINTDIGMIIQEILLYDPTMLGTGQFYDWANGQVPKIDKTGLKGFDVWRCRVTVLDQLNDEQKIADQILADQIEQTLTVFGGKWHILIREGGGRNVYSHLSNEQKHVASAIKVPIAMLFFKSLDLLGIQPSDYRSYLSSNGRGRNYNELLYSMLVLSEEAATDSIIESITKSGLGIYPILRSWGANQTYLFKRYSTAEDIALLLEGLYSGNNIAPEARNIILELTESYTSEDDTRLGVIRPLLPVGGHLYNKRGSLAGEQLVVGDSAIVTWSTADNSPIYYLVVFGYPGGKVTTAAKLEEAIERIGRLFWNYAAHCETFAGNLYPK